MPTGKSGEERPVVMGAGLGEESARELSLGVVVAEAVGVDADAIGEGGAVATLGVDVPVAPPRLTGGQTMTALAEMSPLASTVVEKQ